MSFSQRKGLKPVRSVIQKDSMDESLRSGLWNALHLYVWKKYQHNLYTGHFENSNLWGLFQRYWYLYYKKPLDALPNNFYEALEQIRNHFFQCPWYEVYDFVEFTTQNLTDGFMGKFIDSCNLILESEMSACRLVNKQIIEITAEEEISSIEEAIKNTDSFNGVQTHLQTALSLLADRKQPDYRNSIKESISAVEALAKVLTGDDKATLGDALKILEKNSKLHGSLKSGFSSLYGWTSAAEGIRHAMLDDPNLKFDDAKFMLVACTAFVNYLIGKTSEITPKS
jgi:hypothetical protein